MATPDELNARENVKYINENMMDKARIESMSEDHYTYLYIYESSRDTDVKPAYIEFRKRAIILQKEQSLLDQGMNQGAGSTG